LDAGAHLHVANAARGAGPERLAAVRESRWSGRAALSVAQGHWPFLAAGCDYGLSNMPTFAESTWADIEAVRSRLMEKPQRTVAAAAGGLASDLAGTFTSVVLARVFLVLPLDHLPPAERAVAARAAHGDPLLRSSTRVLSLVGTAGHQSAWCDRARSTGHLAVPLVSRAAVEEIPMIARLLSDLQVDLGGLDAGETIATQRMLGGSNGKFRVDDAQSAQDRKGRFVIPARDFVKDNAVRTVFGMGGAYAEGTVAVVVIFTNEIVPSMVTDRFPSLISNFKMATTPALMAGAIYG
jgi:hypothetical protein